MTDDIQRRSQVDQLVPAERVIRDAVAVVEEMGTDPRLTHAVMFLDLARDCVADFVDDKESSGKRYFSGETAELIAKWIEGYGDEPIDAKLAAAAIREQKWIPVHN